MRRNEIIDHFRLNLAKMAYCQYLKRVKIKRTCYMCLDPESKRLLVQELGLDFTNVQCARHQQATQEQCEGIMLDVITDRDETEEDRKLLAEACKKCSSSLPDGTPYEAKDKEKSCKDKFDGDLPDLKETEEELLLAPIRKLISAVCPHVWIFKFICCYSKGERKQQLLIAIRKVLADYDMDVERYLADDPCHILKLTNAVAEFLPPGWRKQFIDFFNQPGNVSMGGMHCWNHVPECMNAIFFKNWIVSLFGEMVEGPFAHIKKNMGSDSNLIKSYFKISMESRIDAYLDKRFRNMAKTNLEYRIEDNPKKIRALEEEVQDLVLKLEKNGGLEKGIVDLKKIRKEYLLPILRWKVETLMDERKGGLSYEYIKHRLRACYFEIRSSGGSLPIQKSKLSLKLWNRIAGPWSTDNLHNRLTSCRRALVESAKKLHESDESFPAKLEKQPLLEGKFCQQLIDGYLMDVLLPSTHEKLHLLLREIEALKSKKTYGAERKFNREHVVFAAPISPRIKGFYLGDVTLILAGEFLYFGYITSENHPNRRKIASGPLFKTTDPLTWDQTY